MANICLKLLILFSFILYSSPNLTTWRQDTLTAKCFHEIKDIAFFVSSSNFFFQWLLHQVVFNLLFAIINWTRVGRLSSFLKSLVHSCRCISVFVFLKWSELLFKGYFYNYLLFLELLFFFKIFKLNQYFTILKLF